MASLVEDVKRLIAKATRVSWWSGIYRMLAAAASWPVLLASLLALSPERCCTAAPTHTCSPAAFQKHAERCAVRRRAGSVDWWGRAWHRWSAGTSVRIWG